MQFKKRNKKVLVTILISIIILLTIAGAVTQYLTQPKKGQDILLFYHWWVSAGEQTAINSLINLFSEKYPETTILPTPIITQSSSGGGNVLFNLVESEVSLREAPDAFQMHAGYEGRPFFEAGLLEPVNDIWESEGLTKVVPRIIQAMCQFQGEYYSVPIDIHRTNIVWYNKELLDKNNINPVDLNNWDKFFAACDKLKNSGINYPIQMGTTWTAQHTFDQIIASIGIDFYEDWINGKVTSANDPRLLEAFSIFKKYLSYVNPDHEDISWDTATGRIIDGEGAFNIMGDWANGEFKAKEKEYNKDYGTFEVPGTDGMYGLVIDAFQRPKNIRHPESSERWLKLVASKEGQDTFNPAKGSISVQIETGHLSLQKELYLLG